MSIPPPSSEIPSGWYPDPDGRGQRYWDGGRWTEHIAPTAPAAAAPAPGPTAKTGDWVGGVLLAVLLPLIGLIAGAYYIARGGERRQVGLMTVGLSCVAFLAYIALFSRPSGSTGY